MATDGGATMANTQAKGPVRGRWAKSFALRLFLLLVVFTFVPVILYQEFQSADEEKNRLLLSSVSQKGRLTAMMLRPLMQPGSAENIENLNRQLQEIGQDDDTVIRVLFRPSGQFGAKNFYLISAWPMLTGGDLEAERNSLIQSGVLDKIRDSCDWNFSAADRLQPGGEEAEIVTSVSPVLNDSGCWVVITSDRTAAVLNSSLGREYWRTPEVQIAAVIYLVMAIAVVILFLDGWRNLRQFGRLAGRITHRDRGHASFRAMNRIPELDTVAAEFDRMVSTLRGSARMLRQTAEENAHALKAPVAVIAQALEPLRRHANETTDARFTRAIQVIEKSVSKLDNLVSTVRKLDETTADVYDGVMEEMDLSVFLSQMVKSYQGDWAVAGIRLVDDIAPGARVLGTEDILETALENILDNAADFSPKGGNVYVSLSLNKDMWQVDIADEGPGVPGTDCQRIFDRYVSERPAFDDAESEDHYGIGLWIARRNIEALGGRISATNRAEGGLHIRIGLPAQR